MKDINDAQTIDWVDEVELTDNERKFLENLQDPDACAWLISAWSNMSHSVALNNLTDRTITDILNNQQEQ